MSIPPSDNEPQDAAYWAQVSLLQVTRVPTGALNLNVEGRHVVGPLLYTLGAPLRWLSRRLSRHKK